MYELKQNGFRAVKFTGINFDEISRKLDIDEDRLSVRSAVLGDGSRYIVLDMRDMQTTTPHLGEWIVYEVGKFHVYTDEEFNEKFKEVN